MASPNPRKSLYPEVIQSNPDANSPFSSNPNHSSSSSSLYPKVDMNEVAEKLFPDHEDDAVLQQNPSSQSQPTSFKSSEEVLIRIPGAIVHLIDKQQSVELANGELTIVGLRQGDNVVAVLCRVGDEIQWPLARDEAAVKLDESHYFFALHVPSETKSDDENESENTNSDSENSLNYGLTIASKGQKDGLLKELDGILENYSAFSVQKVSEAVDGSVVAKEISPEEMKSEAGKELMEDSSAAYWTTLAPNVEDYSSTAARLIAGGSQQLIKGILWCGDVTVDSMKWGHEFLKMRVGPGSNSQISPQAMRRVKRVKNMTKRSEKVASGILSGVVKVSGFFTSSVVNSKVGNKFFSLLPGEIILASLDGFNKVCDAVEVAGKNVMSTTSVVTTGLVSHRYGEQAGKVTNDGLDAAGYAMGTAWAVFKIRKALNPKRAVKPTTFAKAAAQASYAALKAKK